MKQWLVLILLLVVAAGTFIPCCELDDCCADQIVNKSNHDKHKSEGACSPFFACATCSASVALTKPIQLVEPTVEKTVYHPVAVKFNLPSYSSSLWQPPRLS